MSILAHGLRATAGNTSGGGVETSLSYQDFDSFDGTATTSRTFSGMAFGDEDINRYVVVGVHTFDSTSGINVTSVTIGGETATALIKSTANVLTTTSLWIAQPTGTSGDIVMSCSGTNTTWGASTWSLITSNSTPASTGQQAGASNVSFTDDYKTASLFISMGLNDSNPTWNNATKSYGVDTRSGEWASGAIGELINSTGTVSTNEEIGCACYATWI